LDTSVPVTVSFVVLDAATVSDVIVAVVSWALAIVGEAVGSTLEPSHVRTSFFVAPMTSCFVLSS
jgi:hypothetical protein